MAKTKILVVDDERDYLEIACAILRDAGFSVAAAENGADALANIRENKPALVVLDIGLPDIDGFEIKKRIRRNSEIADIKIIFFTVYTDMEHVKNAVADDDVKYIVKPFKPETLIEKVKDSLS